MKKSQNLKSTQKNRLTKQTVEETVHECFIKIGFGKTSSATLACGHDS